MTVTYLHLTVGGAEATRGRLWNALVTGFTVAVVALVGAGLAQVGTPLPSLGTGDESPAGYRSEPVAVLAAVSSAAPALDATVTLWHGAIVMRPADIDSASVDIGTAGALAASDLGRSKALVCRLGLLSTAYQAELNSVGFLNSPVWMCVQVVPGVALPAGLGRPDRLGRVDFIDARNGTTLFDLPAVG